MDAVIYALYWEAKDLVYVGQTSDFKRRKYVHQSKMKAGKHENYKIQDAYNKYGQPELIVLQECSINELPTLEAIQASQFDNLLNIVEPGIPSGIALNAPASVYSKIDILRVFILLYKYNMSYRNIAKKVKMSKSSIERIGIGSSHRWLAEDYPLQYSIMRDNIYNRSRNKAQISNKLK